MPSQVAVIHGTGLLSLRWLSTCLPMRGSEWIPWFALLTGTAFAALLTLFPMSLSESEWMTVRSSVVRWSARNAADKFFYTMWKVKSKKLFSKPIFCTISKLTSLYQNMLFPDSDEILILKNYICLISDISCGHWCNHYYSGNHNDLGFENLVAWGSGILSLHFSPQQDTVCQSTSKGLICNNKKYIKMYFLLPNLFALPHRVHYL